jgi:HEAT repeat protein
LVTYESWRFWWAYNNDEILRLKSRLDGSVSSSPLALFDTLRNPSNRRMPQRATIHLLETVVGPALARRIEDPREHEDVRGGAIVARGRIGKAAFVPDLGRILRNDYRNARGEKVECGGVSTESAALALGLLPGLAPEEVAAVRDTCLRAVADESLRTRERTWAAVSLGLQRDRDAVPALFRILTESRFADENVPCGILAGIGLAGPGAGDCLVPDGRGGEQPLLGALIEAFEPAAERLGRLDLTDRIRSFVGYALAKMERPDALDGVLRALRSRRAGLIHRRSAAIAAGALGAVAPPEAQERAVAALRAFLGKSNGDRSGENFAVIALSQVGTADALRTCLGVCAEGTNDRRAFSALGLATRLLLRERAGAGGTDAALRGEFVDLLRRLSERVKDRDTVAALFLARGMLRERTAIDPLLLVAGDPGRDPVLRGYACVSLGLLGDASPRVKETLRLALRDRKSSELRSDAATGLGLLRDADVVRTLLEELRSAKSLAVKAQVIQAIGTIGDHSAIEPLVGILEDPGENEGTRAMAAVGLGMIGDLEEIARLARLSKNYNYRASVRDIDDLLYIL